MRVYYAAGETVEVKPAGSERTYYVRCPSARERPRFRRRVQQLGGRQWGHLDMLTLLRDEATRLLGQDAPELAGIIEVIDAHKDQFQAALSSWRADPNDDAARALLEALRAPPLLAGIEQQVLAASELYAGRVADRSVFEELRGIAAAEMFLDGWFGEGLPGFRRVLNATPDELLDFIPSDDLIAIGNRVGELVDPPQDTVGNSSSESPGGSEESSSKAAKKRRANGHSPSQDGMPSPSSDGPPSPCTQPTS